MQFQSENSAQQKKCSSKLKIRSTMTYLRNNYHIRHIIGQGGFGKVFKAIKKSNNKPVALKFISKDKITEYCIHEKTFQKVPFEAVLLSQCQGIPGVIKLLEIVDIEERDVWCLVMERNPNCIDLFDYINQHAPLSEETAIYILNQLLHTLIGCHKSGVAHRDIKDENILIDINSKEITLIDFGSGNYYHNELFYDYNGTIIYSSPEWIRYGQYYVDELETWSIGVLLVNMVTGDVPFKTQEDIVNLHVFIDCVSEECNDLIQRCIHKEREHRITLDKILSHPFFQKYHLSMSCQ